MMNNSTSSRRWLILALVAAGILLLRIFRGEALHGLNPLLFLILPIALYIGYRLARRT